MKLFIRLKISLAILLVIQLSAYSQDNSVMLISPPTSGDSTVIGISELPKQVPVISVEKTTPSYNYFYIYGDGDFDAFTQITEEKHSSNHRYPYPSVISLPTNYIARAYGVGIYSNGKPPPRRLKSISFPSDSDSNIGGEIDKKRIVDSSEFVKLLPHAQAKMGEPLVYVLAFNNPLDVPIANAELFLFFESEIIENITSTKGEKEQESIGQFGKFPIEEVLIHNNNTSIQSNLYGNSLPSNIKYKHAIGFEVNELAPNEEEHIFLEFTVDSIMFDAFDAQNKAELNFTAVIISRDSNLPDSSTTLDDDDITFMLKNGISDLSGLFQQVTPDTTIIYRSLNDSTEFNGTIDEFQGNTGVGLVLGMDNNTISLVKGHDPNFLEAVSCACPNSSSERNKLIITLHAENDGLGEVNEVHFDMELPEGLTAADIVGNPITHHPFVDNAVSKSIDFIEYEVIDDKHVRWHLTNQGIYSALTYGSGDERTYAELTFAAFTDAEPSSFDSLLQVCVRFNGENTEAVCTYPVNVKLMESTTANLNCVSCSEDPNTKPWWKAIPCWLWIIIILLLIWLLIRYIRSL